MLHSVSHVLPLQQHTVMEIVFLLSLVFHKKSVFYCAAHLITYIFVSTFYPMSGSSNCSHIIEVIDGGLFSCCIYFTEHLVTFNSPSSVNIFEMMSYWLFTVTDNTCGKPPVVSTLVQCMTVSSNCCMFNETPDGSTFMDAMVTVYSLVFSSIYLL